MSTIFEDVKSAGLTVIASASQIGNPKPLRVCAPVPSSPSILEEVHSMTVAGIHDSVQFRAQKVENTYDIF